jgi:hypothetical protein
MANLDDLPIFVKVAQFESISRAADLPNYYGHTLCGRDLRRKPINLDSHYRFPR